MTDAGRHTGGGPSRAASDAHGEDARGNFSGVTADYYQRYRRGYPPDVVTSIVQAFGLHSATIGPADAPDVAGRYEETNPRRAGGGVVLDLGCGTGQLTLPLAAHARVAIGMDPEPDMLRWAARTAAECGIRNVVWLLGADTDVGSLHTLLGERPLDIVTIGTAMHFMAVGPLLARVRNLVRPGGGVAILANGVPMWLQDTTWARALREQLESWFGPVKATCGTSEAERDEYARELCAAGFTDVRREIFSYDVELGIEEIIGQTFSAISVDQLPVEERLRFERELRQRLADLSDMDPVSRQGPGGTGLVEHVDVDVLLGWADPP